MNWDGGSGANNSTQQELSVKEVRRITLCLRFAIVCRTVRLCAIAIVGCEA